MDAIHELYHALTTSDYVLVGAGAGLSAAAGISFADERAFKRDYPALWAQGVHSDYQTFSYKGWLPGQRWGYLCRHIKAVLLDTPALPLYDDLKALLLAIGDNESSNGMYAYYQSQTSNFQELGWRYRFNLINNQASDYVYYCQLDDPTFEKPFFLFTSEYWKTYIQEMAEFAAAGCWPKDAISNTNAITTLFENGQSATSRGNYYNGITMIQGYRDKGMNVELFDIFPEGYRPLRDSYLGDGYAIPIFCEQPERAAMVLDYIQCDYDTNMLLAGGVEGRHYIYDEATNTVAPGPEVADYEFDGWAWGIRHKDFPWPKSDDERINAANAHLKEAEVQDEEWPYWGFQFSPTPVSAEWAVISALVTEYQPSFDLGMFGDQTMATYEEFVNQLKGAGLDKYMEEWNRQRDEFLANKAA